MFVIFKNNFNIMNQNKILIFIFILWYLYFIINSNFIKWNFINLSFGIINFNHFCFNLIIFILINFKNLVEFN